VGVADIVRVMTLKGTHSVYG